MTSSSVWDPKVIHFRIHFFKMISLIARCLQRLNVTFGDTRDEWGHQRFIPFNVEEFYSNEGANMNFIHDADFYPFEKVSS